MVTKAAAIDETQAFHRSEIIAPEILPLENGDRLTRAEFERRYLAMPHLKKAELIEGVVHMPSPVRASHSHAHSAIMTWLGAYQVATPGTTLHDNGTVRLDADNEVQPDALLRLDPKHGGRSRISEDDYLEGPPELIVEIAASSAAYDLHDKLDVYRRNGVSEYLVWRVYDKQLDWFALREGRYIPLAPDTASILHSHIFPGLQLAVTALLTGNLAQVMAVLRQGLDSETYRAFLTRVDE